MDPRLGEVRTTQKKDEVNHKLESEDSGLAGHITTEVISFLGLFLISRVVRDIRPDIWFRFPNIRLAG